MITVHSDAPLIVSTPTSASLAFSAGRWEFEQLTTVRGGTNAPVNVSTARDGAVITIDASGWVEVYPGPNLSEAAVWGLGLSFLTVGMILFTRWVVRRWGNALVSSGGIE